MIRLPYARRTRAVTLATTILAGFLLLAFAFSRCATPATSRAQAAPLNIVLILADDQGAHLSALGTPGIATPNVDALADRGILFTQAFAVVPSCSPSRSSINTGMYPHANGHWRNTITPLLGDPASQFGRASTRVDQVGIHEYIRTLPEVLAERGYFTAITQKFHMSPPWKFPYSVRNPVHNDPAEYERVIGEFIEQAGERPFFFQANVSPPHRPFKNDIAGRPELLPDTSALMVPGYLPAVPLVQLDLQEYFAAVQLADACAGGIIAALRAKGKLENTLIIYTSDQGAPYHRAKASAYAAGLHVPFVVAGPGVVHGQRSDALISLIDLMPTVLDYFGIPVPETVQGRSLRSLFAGEAKKVAGRDYLFGEHNSHGPPRSEHYPTRMVYDGRYYYLKNLLPGKSYLLPADLSEEKGWGNRAYRGTVEAAATHPRAYAFLRELESGRPAEELYDMANDPEQLHNVAQLPAYRQEKARLAAALEAWRKSSGDAFDDPAQIPTRQEAPLR
ncbi:sulfatase [Neolewinella lacunae]|uniref:Sulfatase n=1 Tax=Neolewinella lacunae TaxID=1517758 RepID=A0A923PM78_9BACT|nr:sulfatase [Neolewinella lacunae]MBC6996615.1 sulfatase [Neolewinella lacunae]MDN3634821.1 sulfatase [Neolewinella lacunae]